MDLLKYNDKPLLIFIEEKMKDKKGGCKTWHYKNLKNIESGFNIFFKEMIIG